MNRAQRHGCRTSGVSAAADVSARFVNRHVLSKVDAGIRSSQQMSALRPVEEPKSPLAFVSSVDAAESISLLGFETKRTECVGGG